MQIYPRLWLAFLVLFGVSSCHEYDASKYFKDIAAIKGLDLPTAFIFSPDDGVFVAEKKGVIKYFSGLGDLEPIVVANLEDEVHNFADRGLLDIKLDPKFPERPYLFALYTYDAPFGVKAPYYFDQNNLTPSPPAVPGPVTGKLVRLTLAPTTDGWVMTETKELIHDWCQVFTSHSIGSLAFGPDGALYVSGGDGASFTKVDYGQFENYCDDPRGEGGALRSQDLETEGDPVTLDGAILRVDPETGDSLFDNPLAGQGALDDDRIIAYGLRNPFRFTFKPGTSELWVGDVGWGKWEEINRIKDLSKVRNFGWPCFEGPLPHSGYARVPMCLELYAKWKRDSSAVSLPHAFYRHTDLKGNPTSCGTSKGGSVSGLAFYTGKSYPRKFKGALLVSDYSKSCIWAEFKDGSRAAFMNVHGPVQLQAGPADDIFYASITKGEIRRICSRKASWCKEALPPEAVFHPEITEPAAESSAAPGANVSFAGHATDSSGNPVAVEFLTWRVVVRHCVEESGTDCHDHFQESFERISAGSFAMPADHESGSYVELRLRVGASEARRRINFRQ